MTASDTADVLDRQSAVDQLAGHIADRTGFLVVAPPSAVATLAARLHRLPAGWTAYVDHGVPAVLATNIPRALGVLDVLGVPYCAVVAVPKTVPARTLSDVLGQDLPDDGSRDLIFLHDEEGQAIVWPLLFVDALAIVDPAAAAAIHVNALTNLS
jgi:hypothetical protein